MRQPDISYALNLVLQALLPPLKQTGAGGGASGRLHHLSVSDVGRSGSMASQHGRKNMGHSSANSDPRDYLQNIALLGTHDWRTKCRMLQVVFCDDKPFLYIFFLFPVEMTYK